MFVRYTHVLDAELQQRACEYLALARRPESDDLLSTLFDEMPVFPERESALLNRLHSKGDQSHDKRTWVIGGKDENSQRQNERTKALRKGTGDSAAIMEGASNAVASSSSAAAVAAVRERNGSASSGSAMNPPVVSRDRSASLQQKQDTLTDDNMMGTSGPAADDVMESLRDLDLAGGGTIRDEPLLMPDGQTPSDGVNGSAPTVQTATLGGVNPALLAPLTVHPNIDKVRRCPSDRDLHPVANSAVAGAAIVRDGGYLVRGQADPDRRQVRIPRPPGPDRLVLG